MCFISFSNFLWFILHTSEVLIVTTNCNIFVSIVGSISSNGGVSNPKCGANYSVPEGQGMSLFCRPSLYGRYVTITKRKTGPLTLCEVEVYSAQRGAFACFFILIFKPLIARLLSQS